MRTTPFCRWPLALFTVLLCCGAALAQAPAKSSLSAQGAKQLDELFAEAVSKKQVPGAVALVAVQGKTVYLKGFGMQDVEAGKAMPTDALFRVASMTKPVTSVAALILVEEGKLKLDEPIAKFLPEFKEMKVLVPGKDGAEPTTVPADKPITAHHLLTHTSGIPYGFFAPALAALHEKAGVAIGLSQTEGTIADNVKRLAALPLAHQPGAAFTYGLSTDVLGRLVEVVAGKPLDQFMQERIFKPLKMTDTYFFLPPDKIARLAALYTPSKDFKDLVRTGEDLVKEGQLTYSASYPYKGPKTFFSGGAGLVSTASDYARFLQMLLNDGELDGARVLKAETVKQMTTNQIGDKSLDFFGMGNKFGYGFGVVGEASKGKEVASVGTFTWGGIFHTYFWADPERKVIGILMSQVYPNGHLKIGEPFRKRVYEALE